MKQFSIAAAAILLAALSSTAQLAITEVMTQDANNTRPDWWEITNFGTNNVDMSGYSWNDDSHGGFAGTHNSAPFSGVIVHPRESVIFTEQKGSVTDAASFRAWWGLSTNVQVIALLPTDNGLGLGGDSVRLWSTNFDAMGTFTNGLDLNQAPEFLVDRVDTLAAIAGRSLVYNSSNGSFGLSSTNGINGAFQSAISADFGSPGFASTNPAPIVIVSQPTNLFVNVSTPGVFQITAYGLPKPRFQWLFNGAAVDTNVAQIVFSVVNNQSRSTLTITNVQTTNAGTFRVLVSNGFQTLVSSNATLTVNSAPLAPIFTQRPPTNLYAYLGQNPMFAATALANPPPAFQWLFNGTILPGQTDAQLTLSLAETNQAGLYTLIATNIAGTNSTSVLLTITPKPNLRITEIMSSEVAGGSHNDWWELSNLDTFPVNLQNFRFDDNSAFTGIPAFSQAYTVPSAVIIAPGESIVFVEDMTPDEFRSWWGADQLPPNLQIISYHGGSLSFSGTTGDALTVWNGAASLEGDFIDSVSIQADTNAVSFGFDPYTRTFLGTTPNGVSVLGTGGTITAAVNGDIGSPGTIINYPRFTGLARTGNATQLTWSSQSNYTYTVQAKTNLNASTWNTLTNVIALENLSQWMDTNSASQRFYRLLVNP